MKDLLQSVVFLLEVTKVLGKGKKQIVVDFSSVMLWFQLHVNLCRYITCLMILCRKLVCDSHVQVE